MSSRSAIPEALQLQIRQKCGFGCVICGCPIFQIHHIEPYAANRTHDAENLTLLCPNHHTEVTNGLLTTPMIKKATSQPYVIRRGSSARHPFSFEGNSCRVWFGDSDASSADTAKRFSALVIDRTEMLGFRFHEGRLLLNLAFVDEQNQLILTVQDGMLQFVPKIWDIRFKGRTLTLRHSPRKVRLEIEFCPPHAIRITRGLFLLNGVAFKIAPKGMCLLNLGWQMAFDQMQPLLGDHQVAISLGTQPDNVRPGLVCNRIPRYNGLSFGTRVKDLRSETQQPDSLESAGGTKTDK